MKEYSGDDYSVLPWKEEEKDGGMSAERPLVNRAKRARRGTVSALCEADSARGDGDGDGLRPIVSCRSQGAKEREPRGESEALLSATGAQPREFGGEGLSRRRSKMRLFVGPTS